MTAASLANEPFALLELLAEARKCEEAGEEGMIKGVLAGMDDAELPGTVMVLHDSMRSIANAQKMKGLQLLLSLQTSALVSAFLRFEEETFGEVMSQHIPWTGAGEGEDDD